MSADRQPPSVAVIGAGPAGMMAAIAAAQAGARVTLYEQLARPGVKLLATGGGRCNLTNLTPAPAFLASFGRQGRFMSPAMASLPPEALREFFDRLGVPTVAEDGLHVFPASGRAADIQSALLRRLAQLGVCLRPHSRVTGLLPAPGGPAEKQVTVPGLPDAEKQVTVPILEPAKHGRENRDSHLFFGGRVGGVEGEGGWREEAQRVVLACGGCSWPRLGGTGGGYELARQAGHTIVEPVPALTPLIMREKWTGKLAGVSVAGARVWIEKAGQGKAGVTGDVLFTHHGLSGPAILDISGAVARLLRAGEPVPIRIELIAGVGAGLWRQRLEEWRTRAGGRGIVSLLREQLPESLCRVLCEQAGVDAALTAAQLPAAGRDALAGLLGAMPLTVIETKGFDVAFVTRGGVKLQEVAPDTLASRLLPGLFFAGELLDLDGPCGGFNLQWAFASGHLAGQSAAGIG